MTYVRLRPWFVLAPFAALCAAMSWVEACGPDWAPLLPRRAIEWREPIPQVLEMELRAITLPSPLDAALRKTLAADAARQADTSFETPADREARVLKALQQGLGPEQAQAFAAARAGSAAASAPAAGVELPPAWRLYAAAAADWRTEDHQTAARRFQQLLALPATDAQPLAIATAYSLGRLQHHLNRRDAEQAFAAARAWRARGAPDPLGLAVDSLGEEALLHLTVRQDDSGLTRLDAEGDDEFVAATRLYFEQARLGSRSGVESLRQIQAALFDDEHPGRLQRLLAQGWGQALLVRLLADQGFWVDAAQAGSRYQQATAAIAATPAVRLAEPERWAALAWQQGDLAHARQWAGDKPTTALGAWTRAKLALTQGDSAGAARWFAAAVQAWPPGGDATQPGRLRAEQGLLQLQRGELPLGLRTLMAAGNAYALDAAFVAESLLTSAELRTVVDDIAPAAATDRSLRSLRHLLARRLMREGRFVDAIGYFPTHYDLDRWARAGLGAQTIDLAALAQQYVDALARADRAWTRVGRAEALMQAGHLARQYGLQLMGFELGADGAWADGGFDMTGGGPAAQGIGTLEAQRVAQPQPTLPMAGVAKGTPLPRYHYRYVAAQHALQAAAALPQRSQAFASSLCHAALWVGPRDDAFVATMWTRYTRDGAHVPWAGEFGQRCPEPEFAAARRLQARESVREAAPWLHRHPMRSAAAAALATVALLAGGLWAWRRRALPPA